VILVEQPAEWLRWRTLWRFGVFVVLVALVILFLQAFPPDVALLGAIDTTSFLEIFSIVALIAARGHARRMLRSAARLARQAVQGSALLIRMAMQRVDGFCRRRAGGAPQRRSSLRDGKESDDDLGRLGWGVLA